MKDGDIIRKRPGMYVGDIDDGTGLHNMVFEIVHNALDEARAGFGESIEVVLNPDGSCTVSDNGRGIPPDLHPIERVSAAEVILTRLHAGGKYGFNKYKLENSSPGIGVAVVNALSEWFDLRIRRDGHEFHMCFHNGDADAPLKITGGAEGKRGTEITFLPSIEIFGGRNFDFVVLENRIRDLARPEADITLALTDQRNSQRTVFTL